MGIFRRLLGGTPAGGDPPKPQRLDYLNEALALERQGDYDAAITSYRLALRDHPNDPRILQNLAIALSRTGQSDDAVRHYRKAPHFAETLRLVEACLEFSGTRLSRLNVSILERVCRHLGLRFDYAYFSELGLPVEALRDVFRIYVLVLPLLLIASLWEFGMR